MLPVAHTHVYPVRITAVTIGRYHCTVVSNTCTVSAFNVDNPRGSVMMPACGKGEGKCIIIIIFLCVCVSRKWAWPLLTSTLVPGY